MALIPYVSTFKAELSETPTDFRPLVSDTPGGNDGTFLKYFIQADGDGIQWADANTAPAADDAWHKLADGDAVILAVPETGDRRPWFRATGDDAVIVVSGANAI